MLCCVVWCGVMWCSVVVLLELLYIYGVPGFRQSQFLPFRSYNTVHSPFAVFFLILLLIYIIIFYTLQVQ